MLGALPPAIAEEVADRAVFLAACVTLLRGRPAGRPASAAVWFAVTVPHLVPHVAGQAAFQPFASTLVTLAVLFVLFALPFAALQLRRDVTSAMVAHGLVDLIRFVVFGA